METKRPKDPKHDDNLDDMNITKKVKFPKKGDYRMRAHINPLGDTPFPYPLNPEYVDLRKHFPCIDGSQPIDLVNRFNYRGYNYFNNTNMDPLDNTQYLDEQPDNTQQQQGQDMFFNTMQYPLDYNHKVDPKFNGSQGPRVNFIDIGCGFGGLLFALSQEFPDKLSMGMEIRDKLVNYVGKKIECFRHTSNYQHYLNISVIRQNTMRHLTNYFLKASLEKIFICFPDPHFKRKNYRRRIINPAFVAEYSYLLQKGGKLYAITDVKDLHLWHEKHLAQHPLFQRLSDEEAEKDKCVQLIWNKTEEGIKVSRNKGDKYVCVYEKVKE